MDKKRVHFINVPYRGACGVYQHGETVRTLLKFAPNLELVDNPEDSQCLLINYHPALNDEHRISKSRLPKLALLHEIGSGSEPEILSLLDHFSALALADPSIYFPNPAIQNKFFKTARPLRQGVLTSPGHRDPVRVGFFGFPFPQKGLDILCKAFAREFYEGVLRLHLIPAGPLTDVNLNTIVDECWKMIKGGKRELEVSRDFLDDSALVSWLSKNHLNCFLYEDSRRGIPPEGSGISSVLDYAIPAQQPILVSNSVQFRHVVNKLPTFPKTTLTQAIALGNQEVLRLCSDWSNRQFIMQHEGIINTLC